MQSKYILTLCSLLIVTTVKYSIKVKCSYLWRKRLVVIQLVRIFYRMAINLLYDMT